MDDFDIVDMKVAIPKALKKDLDLGNNYLMGLLKNSNNNQCVKHLPIVDNIPDGKNLALGKGIFIGIGIAVVTAVGAFAIKKILDKKKASNAVEDVKKVNVDTENLENKISLVADNYNNSLTEYVNNVNGGVLSLKNIKELIEYLNFISEQKNKGDITIDISNKELDALLSIIRKISMKLAEERNYSIDNTVLQIENDKLEEIKEYLYIQKDIIEKY